MIEADKEPLLITAAEVRELEHNAIKLPSKDGTLGPRIIRLFLEHIKITYGIDLEIETEEMRYERTGKRQEGRKQPGRGLKLGRRKSNSSFDDF